VFEPGVVEEVELGVRPEGDVVDVLGQVLEEVEPAGVVALLVLVEEVGEQDAVLPVAGKGLGVVFGVLDEHPELSHSYFWI